MRTSGKSEDTRPVFLVFPYRVHSFVTVFFFRMVANFNTEDSDIRGLRILFSRPDGGVSSDSVMDVLSQLLPKPK